MNPLSPKSTHRGGGYPNKRARHSPSSHESRPGTGKGSPRSDEAADILPEPVSVGGTGKTAAASSFRNVSACNRCRLRKNRCDQRLPSCASCEKAGVKCVGYDPITKREIPRR